MALRAMGKRRLRFLNASGGAPYWRPPVPRVQYGARSRQFRFRKRSGNVTNVAIASTTTSYGGGAVTDNFNRANGPLGPNWTDTTDGGLAISSHAVTGTNPNGISGDIRTEEACASNHYSQTAVSSTQLTGGQWIGPAVRPQNGGQNGYLEIYYWNNGTPELMLYKRSGGSNWTQLGDTYNCGPEHSAPHTD
jgi:hypothetical protein